MSESIANPADGATGTGASIQRPENLHSDIRAAVQALCSDFPGPYWRDLDARRAYPSAFVEALSRGGWLSVLIPEPYGGAGLGLSAAAAILQEINRSGANAGAAHAQMYTMAALLHHGSEDLRRRYLPAIADGTLRLQAFGVTEPNAGSETTRIETRAERQGDEYVIHGQKVFISRAAHSDLLLLLARTTPIAEVADKRDGLSLFLVDLGAAVASGRIVVKPLHTMLNHSTTELFIDGAVVPAGNLVGMEGQGFRHILDTWNAERILIAAECLGDGDFFVRRGAEYGSSRRVFGRPVAANQGVQFPLAQAHAHIRAAELMTFHAAALFEADAPCGPEANTAKLLASQASWLAANACLDTYGGYGFATEYDIERKFRETRLYGIAPVSNNLVLAYLGHQVLGMPRSY